MSMDCSRYRQRGFTLQINGGGADQSRSVANSSALVAARCQRFAISSRRESPDSPGDQPFAQITIGSKIARRHTHYCRMPRQVDCVGNHCRRRIRYRSGVGQNGDRVGNPQRKTAATPSTGCDSANRMFELDRGRIPKSEGRSGRSNHSDDKSFSRHKMNRNVAAIIHVSPSQRGCRGHRA